MARIIITAKADADIDAIISTMAQRVGVKSSEKYLGLFDEVYVRLAAHPGSGFARKLLGPNARTMTVSPFVKI